MGLAIAQSNFRVKFHDIGYISNKLKQSKSFKRKNKNERLCIPKVESSVGRPLTVVVAVLSAAASVDVMLAKLDETCEQETIRQ